MRPVDKGVTWSGILNIGVVTQNWSGNVDVVGGSISLERGQ